MKFGMLLILIGIIFAISETTHFGNNVFPSSPAELMCDFVALILVFGGCYLIKNNSYEF